MGNAEYMGGPSGWALSTWSSWCCLRRWWRRGVGPVFALGSLGSSSWWVWEASLVAAGSVFLVFLVLLVTLGAIGLGFVVLVFLGLCGGGGAGALGFGLRQSTAATEYTAWLSFR